MDLKEAQKECSMRLAQINKKLSIEHEPDRMFLSLVEEVGEVARELSKKQKEFRGRFDKEKLGNELSDIISRALVIAEDNEIDMEQAFGKKLDQIKQRFELD